MSVSEIKESTGPLLSASFFIGARCGPYNEDFMLCKENGTAADCLKEGRRVTRCALSVFEDMRAQCAREFASHYECLMRENYELAACRAPETRLNKCMFDKIGLEKVVPGAEGVPIHARKFAAYAEPLSRASQYAERQAQLAEHKSG
ncbi:uncharacterized protein V1510DRAFT_422947 [Dipodascopsis tothii]|uniref:uncharacterized protein n=1 Tax=Dipodascopsis tothii TaxID=44089 RepID=UPI0034CFD24D